MPRTRLFTSLLAFSALCVAQPALKTSAPQKLESRLLSARATYYTPTSAGLRGFHCTLNMDWPRLFQGFGNPIAEDNPAMHYLRSVRLSVSDSLRGEGQLEWADTSTPPDAFAKGGAQMRDGLKQMMTGFFKSWNAYMNGGMVPVPDDTVTLTQNADGLRLHTANSQFDVTEDFDNNVLLKQAHVLTSEMDILALPAYDQTPEGLRIASIASTIRQPKTAPPVLSTMTIKYAPVSGYQIPNFIGINIQNVGNFDFPLSNCAVDTEKK